MGLGWWFGDWIIGGGVGLVLWVACFLLQNYQWLFFKIIDLVQIDSIHSMQQRVVLFQTFTSTKTPSQETTSFLSKKTCFFPFNGCQCHNALFFFFFKSLAGAMLFGELPASQEVLRTKRLVYYCMSLGYGELFEGLWNRHQTTAAHDRIMMWCDACI